MKLLHAPKSLRRLRSKQGSGDPETQSADGTGGDGGGGGGGGKALGRVFSIKRLRSNRSKRLGGGDEGADEGAPVDVPESIPEGSVVEETRSPSPEATVESEKREGTSEEEAGEGEEETREQPGGEEAGDEPSAAAEKDDAIEPDGDDEEEQEDGGEEEGAASDEAAEDATADKNSADVPASSSKLSTKGSQASSSTKGSAAAKEGSTKGGSVDGKSSSRDNSGDADSVKTPCDVSDAKSGKSYVSLKERLEKRGEIVDGIHAADPTDRKGCDAAPGLGDVLRAVDGACSPRVADAKEMLGEAGGLVGDAAKKRWEKFCSPNEGELVKDAKELIGGDEARDDAVVASGRSQETMETTETDGVTADTTKLSRDETMETKDSIDILFKYFGCAAGR